MQQRLTLSHQMFCAGLLIMLAAGILSTTVWTAGGYVMPIFMLGGATLALGARLWRYHLRRHLGRESFIPDLGGYPLDLLRHPRFSARSH